MAIFKKMKCNKCGFEVMFMDDIGTSTLYCKKCDKLLSLQETSDGKGYIVAFAGNNESIPVKDVLDDPKGEVPWAKMLKKCPVCKSEVKPVHWSDKTCPRCKKGELKTGEQGFALVRPRHP